MEHYKSLNLSAFNCPTARDGNQSASGCEPGSDMNICSCILCKFVSDMFSWRHHITSCSQTPSPGLAVLAMEPLPMSLIPKHFSACSTGPRIPCQSLRTCREFRWSLHAIPLLINNRFKNHLSGVVFHMPSRKCLVLPFQLVLS